MEMHQLRYALAVYKYRNFTHAAKVSNVSQPALTAAVGKLEAELGGQLFLRDRSGCQPTELGRLLKPRLERIIAEHEAAKVEAIRHARLDRVPISIGVSETIGTNRIASALEDFRRTVPLADIEITVADRKSLFTGLDDGSIEVAIVLWPNLSADLYSTRAMYEERYVVAMAIQHPLASLSELKLKDLETTDLLDRPNCEMREVLRESCEAKEVRLYAAYRSNRIEWLLRMTAEGMGVVVLPETAVPAGMGIVTRVISDAPLTRKIIAARRRHQPSRPEIEKLIVKLSKEA